MKTLKLITNFSNSLSESEKLESKEALEKINENLMQSIDANSDCGALGQIAIDGARMTILTSLKNVGANETWRLIDEGKL